MRIFIVPLPHTPSTVNHDVREIASLELRVPRGRNFTQSEDGYSLLIALGLLLVLTTVLVSGGNLIVNSTLLTSRSTNTSSLSGVVQEAARIAMDDVRPDPPNFQRSSGLYNTFIACWGSAATGVQDSITFAPFPALSTWCRVSYPQPSTYVRELDLWVCYASISETNCVDPNQSNGLLVAKIDFYDYMAEPVTLSFAYFGYGGATVASSTSFSAGPSTQPIYVNASVIEGGQSVPVSLFTVPSPLPLSSSTASLVNLSGNKQLYTIEGSASNAVNVGDEEMSVQDSVSESGIQYDPTKPLIANVDCGATYCVDVDNSTSVVDNAIQCTSTCGAQEQILQWSVNV